MHTAGISRRRFVARTAGGVIVFATPLGVFAQTQPQQLSQSGTQQVPQPASQQPVPQRQPAIAPNIVQDFVRKAHADLSGTKTMIAEQPTLLNATWDWGGGDFEMAIGGAGHMGNRPIAEFLLAQGARMDIFVAAMLGYLDVVQAMVMRMPRLLQSKGPHGIPLIAHAKAGGPAAEPVVAFLQKQTNAFVTSRTGVRG